MRTVRLFIVVLGVFATLAITFCAHAQVLHPANILIVHAKVYTVNPRQEWAQAVAIRNGKIVAVGTDEAVMKLRGIGTKTIDAGGKLVLPGFVDCHIHFLDGSFSLDRINLEGATDVADIQKRLREYAVQHLGDGWLRGWNYAMFGEEAMPDKKYLDELFPNRPVFLEGYDGHTYWANPKALSLAHITKDTPNPANGEVVRDLQTHEPTGALKESAQELVASVTPKLNDNDKLRALHSGIKWANHNGVARVHSAGGDSANLALLEDLRQSYQLTLRFHIAYFQNPPELQTQDIESIERAHKQYHDAFIDVSTVKFMLDGVVESRSAAFLQPYTDNPTTSGALFWDPQNYAAGGRELDQRGLQLYSRAIGDKAIRTALDYAGRLEKTEGSIEQSKVANLIVLDRNIFEVAPHDIHNTQVVTTMVDGKIVYETEGK